MKDFRLAAQNVNVMWNFCTIFLSVNIDFGQICILYRKLYIEYNSRGRGGIKRRLSNNPLYGNNTGRRRL
jgi:hypothetical protein